VRIGLVTLGCDKNTVDNEYLAGLLAKRGHATVLAESTTDRYDAVVITTCGFIEAAKAQSMSEIDRWARAKRQHGRPRRLILAGCLTQRYAEKILAAYPEIDGLAGVGHFEALADLIEEADPDSGEVCLALCQKPAVQIERRLPRRRLTKRAHAYLKIADGCDHACSFCSIPLMKGRRHSVPAPIILAEARALLRQGIRELNLIAQDLSQYGGDLGPGAPRLPGLLRALAGLEGDFWLRLLYLYPGGVTEELLERIATEPKICRYLDIPLQHLNRGVLKAMKRPWGQVRGDKLFERIRKAVPGVTLRTTFVVGFPGETDEAFEELLDGARRLRIDRVGAFLYSPQEGTAAYSMPNQVDPKLASERYDRLMRTQAAIALELNQARVGGIERVLFEGRDRARRAALARSQAEAAEIDGSIFVKGAGPKRAGSFGRVRIVRADGYDLWAEATPH